MLMQVCAVRVHEEEEQDVDYAEHMFRENLLQCKRFHYIVIKNSLLFECR